ncbi:protein-disulfide reductase DsbD family protein [Corallincola spongiicola]|uniref:Thiol:disulfide interchange protein DsbD N-terminal domain-containing protein n=1 Tax=Corallincola spongiicola TaxID=2520508 RepID=A0ABY1WMP2_9GAMM|nr:protein-disulfide reductase DsbD domain-containing protein [Corallincola spongiicola]TAA43688.1 hypothetical protein EXY25_14145 [Corallincola spongiicola]
MSRWLFLFVVVINALALSSAHAASEPQQHPHIEVQLVSEFSHWQQDTPNWVAVVLRPEHHWHTYWVNPGESGLPTRINWTLPDGVEAGDIVWPTPERIEAAGIINLGFEEETLLLVPLTGEPSAESREINIHADVSWLVCKESCIPGNATLQMTLAKPDGNIPLPTEFAAAFGQARSQTATPLSLTAHTRVLSAEAEQRTLQLAITSSALQQASADLSLAMLAGSDLFVEQESLVQASALPRWQQQGDMLVASLALNDYFTALPKQTAWLLITPDNKRLRFSATAGDWPASSDTAVTAPAGSAQNGAHSLLILMLMALIGGLLLNLMPCVFPVLAIKAVSLMKLRGKEKREARLHGWLYLGGIQASLLLLSGLLLLLKYSGQQIGWGFQLQDPWFLAVLASLMLAMALALFGVFELGARFMSVGQAQISRGGHQASFLSGVLAVVVASPCMTPLMAPAIGTALTLPAIEMILIMLALGFGLALPLWAISMLPRLAAMLPKPGPWLETFKQAMAFPLLLTSVWLLWLLSNHQILAVIATLLLWVIVAMLVWMRRRQLHRTFVVSLGLLLAAGISYQFTLSATQSEQALPEQAYSAERLSDSLSSNQAVLVNMTADWCLTCKVNERITFADSKVKEAFNQLGIAYLVGDWTHRDANITQYLDQFQHAGVPLYVLYDKQGNSQVLPQLLTPTLLIDSLNQAVQVKPNRQPPVE